MKEIKEIQQKSTDEQALEAYQKYQKHERMLKVYEQLSSELMKIENMKNPAKVTQNIYERNGFTTDAEKDQVGEFVEYMDEQLDKHPERKDEILSSLTDLTSQRNRKVIGEMIIKFQDEPDFLIADLDAVAVFKNYGLYKGVVEFQELKENRAFSPENLQKVINGNGITIDMFNKAYKKASEAEKQEQGSDNHFKIKDSSKVVNTAAAILEIAPAEVRRDLESLQRMCEDYDKDIGGVIIVKGEEIHQGVLEGNEAVKEKYLTKLKTTKENAITEVKEYFNRNKGATIDDFAVNCKEFCEHNNILVMPMKQIKENEDFLKNIPKEEQINITPIRQSKRDDNELEVG